MDGILNANKPRGITSHDLVAAVRRLIPGVKVGHAGTLDPAATGVLLLCLGKATRVVEYLMDYRKGYRAEVTLGVTTTTGDAQGEVLAIKKVPPLTGEKLAEVLDSFKGVQKQVPPMYSAVKFRGKPLYYWARRGKKAPRAPREVHIYRLELLEYIAPRMELLVECSRGTYIRALATAIGDCLGCGAHLSALERTFVGPFTLEDAHTPEELQSAAAAGELCRLLAPLDSALDRLAAVNLDQAGILDLQHGRPHRMPTTAAALARLRSSPYRVIRVYDRQGRFRALARWQVKDDKIQVHTEKFFVH